MIALIPIHEAAPYALAILVIWGVSAFSLAVHVHSYLPPGTPISVWTIYQCVLLIVVVCGAILYEGQSWIGSSPVPWALSFPVGIIGGLLIRRIDRTIIRSFWRRGLRRTAGVRPPGPGSRHDLHVQSRSNSPLAATHLAKRRSFPSAGVSRSLQSSLDHEFGLLMILTVGVLEELFYRGFLVQVCLSMTAIYLVLAGLIGSVVVFSLTHIQFGWSHVVAKLPLGIFSLMAVLVLGTVLPAVVAHVVFNWGVWKDRNLQRATVEKNLPTRRIVL